MLALLSMRLIASGANVLDLEGSDFEETITKHDVVVVNFHDPEGQDSRALESRWIEAAQQLKAEGNHIQFASVDAIDNEELADEYEVTSEKLPTIKLFRYGHLDRSVYDNFGPWDSKETLPNLIAFARTKSLAPCDILRTQDDVDVFLEEDKVVFIGFLDSFESRTMQLLCHHVAAKLNFEDTLVSIAVTDQKSLYQSLAGSRQGQAPAVVAISQWDESTQNPRLRAASNERDLVDGEALMAWVKANMLPNTLTFDAANSTLMFRSPVKKHFLLVVAPDSDSDAKHSELRIAELVRGLERAASAHRGKALFAMLAPGADEASANAVEFLKLAEADLPTCVIIDWDRIHSAHKYLYSEAMQGVPMSAEGVVRFADEFFAGRVRPEITSMPIPQMEPLTLEEQEGLAIKSTVSHNFDEIVMEAGKDVLLELYDGSGMDDHAYWPAYEKLAKKFVQDKARGEHVRVARLDYLKHVIELPKAPAAAGLPIFLLFPAHDKSNPITYNGAKSVQGWSKFILMHAQGHMTKQQALAQTQQRQGSQHEEL